MILYNQATLKMGWGRKTTVIVAGYKTQKNTLSLNYLFGEKNPKKKTPKKTTKKKNKQTNVDWPQC